MVILSMYESGSGLSYCCSTLFCLLLLCIYRCCYPLLSFPIPHLLPPSSVGCSEDVVGETKMMNMVKIGRLVVYHLGLSDRVPRCNPKTYGRSYDFMELEDWNKAMEKIFAIIKVLKEKRVNIRTFYIIGEADIWWSTMKTGSSGLNLLGVSF